MTDILGTRVVVERVKAYYPAFDIVPHKLAIVLGSCLGDMAKLIEDPQVIDYADIPDFLLSTVESHAGKLIFGKLAGQVLRLLGVESIILANAAGGINKRFTRGDLMLITDHINLFGARPTRGRNLIEFGPRFFDVSNIYTPSLRQAARDAAQQAGVSIQEGVYCYCTGPQFKTPAEIRAFRILGGDAG